MKMIVAYTSFPNYTKNDEKRKYSYFYAQKCVYLDQLLLKRHLWFAADETLKCCCFFNNK